MTCRAATSATTRKGRQTGAQLIYDNQGQLANWQNTSNSPTSTDTFLYDGEGDRVEQVATSGGTTTSTTYVSELEDITTAGSTSTTTAYYGPALSVNGALSYSLADNLHSVSVSVSANGSMTATQLYDAYGNVRYSSGTLPTSKGYTGQQTDALTGLDYYNARYYDAMAGQFTSSDSAKGGGLNRYVYVAGNSATRTDPTGHYYTPYDNQGGSQLDPATDRPNYYNDFMREYWTDSSDGVGVYDDIVWQASVQRSLDRGSRSPEQRAEDEDQKKDGTGLADWFGLTVVRTPETKGAGGRSPDMYVEIDPGAVQSGIGPLSTADLAPPKYATGIELYKPQADTDWFSVGRGGRPAGIIGEAYEKGGQASIVVIDLDNVDPHGTLDNETLNGYGAQIVYWAPIENSRFGQDPSQVMRVIFMRDGKVVDDFNPLNFGPPNRERRPTLIVVM